MAIACPNWWRLQDAPSNGRAVRSCRAVDQLKDSEKAEGGGCVGVEAVELLD